MKTKNIIAIMKTKNIIAIAVLIIVFLGLVFFSSSVDKSKAYVRIKGDIIETREEVSGDEIVEVEMAKSSLRGLVGYDRNGELAGRIDISFRDVTNPEVDRKLFHSTDIIELEFISTEECPGVYPAGSTYKIAKFRAEGRFDNLYGWNALVWVTTLEEGGERIDSARVRLYYPPSNRVYDSSKNEGGIFTDNYGTAECVDSWRTIVDKGGITIN